MNYLKIVESSLQERLSDNKGLFLPLVFAKYDTNIIGFAACFPYRFRKCYERTAETAIYINPKFHNIGIGFDLLQRLIKAAKTVNLHKLIVIINDKRNTASIKLHKKARYEAIGKLTAVSIQHGKPSNNFDITKRYCLLRLKRKTISLSTYGFY